MSTALPLPAALPLVTGDCHHCGETLTADAVHEGHRAYCCSGCAAAAAWIHGAALDDYYRLRTAPAGRVDGAATDFSAWDRDVVLDEHSRLVPGGREITVLTDAMRCAACAWLLDRALRREEDVREVARHLVANPLRARLVDQIGDYPFWDSTWLL